jgi:hypothetical protein
LAKNRVRKPEPLRTVGSGFCPNSSSRQVVSEEPQADVLSLARLWLADLGRAEPQASENRQGAAAGRMTFGGALTIYREQIETGNLLKPSTRKYRRKTIKPLLQTWPEIESKDVRGISEIG